MIDHDEYARQAEAQKAVLREYGFSDPIYIGGGGGWPSFTQAVTCMTCGAMAYLHPDPVAADEPLPRDHPLAVHFNWHRERP